MAIKISGTTVIDDSRNIQNIGVATAINFSGNITGNINSSGVSTVTTLTSTSLSVGTNAAATTNVDLDVSGTYAGNVVSASTSIDCSSGNYFASTVNGNVTFSVSNVPSSRSYGFVLQVTHTSGNISWFAGVQWPKGTAPTLTTGKVHLFVFVTSNGGSTWRGSALVDYNS